MMSLKRAILFSMLVASAARLSAGLGAQILFAPSAVLPGQNATISMIVQNNGTSPASVSPQLWAIENGAFGAFNSGPVPASGVISPSGQTFTFVYTYAGTACGNVTFTGLASGTDSGGAVAASASSLQLNMICTTTPTMTTTPTPNFTATPVIINPTVIPGQADAKVLGNKFHPGGGATVGFKLTLPFGGAVRIHIYNRQGQKVKSIEKEGVAGDNIEFWDGRGEQGAFVGAGIYAVHMQGKGLNKVAKLVVIK